MKYPNYEIERQNGHVRAMVSMIARREAEVPDDVLRSGLVDASMQLGKLCLELAYTPDSKKRRQSTLRRFRPTDLTGGSQDYLLDMISLQNSPTYVERAQQQMHESVADRLRAEMAKQKPHRGTVVELAGLGLLTRYAHPWMLAFPSLVHHERDLDKTMHYDIGLSVTNGERSSAHLLQVKSMCSGRCCQGVAQFDTQRYSRNVQFISGCCDLGMANKVPTPDLRVPHMLIAELEDKASPDMIKTLDVLTDNLLFNATADLLPRGTAERQRSIPQLSRIAV